MEIKITSQDGKHQYDADGRAITDWHHKKCCWIVKPEFEGATIDWYGKDSDFPAGCTLAQFVAQNPYWDKIPDIRVSWTWETAEKMMRALGQPTSLQEYEWYNKTKFPHTDTRSWGYIDEPKETAVERFGKHCNFHRGADRTVVTYNGEIIFDGKLL